MEVATGSASSEPVAAISWGAIFAGALVAVAASLILFILGSGLGLAAVSPWQALGGSDSTPAVLAAIWLIITQWLAAGLGGFLTGRLRVRWIGTHAHEVFFRDTAHGLVTWALATLLIAALALSGSAALVGAGGHALDAATAGASASAAQAARSAAATGSLLAALSMLVGAFIACVAAALGGQHRDLHP